jgi:hypothetical protein
MNGDLQPITSNHSDHLDQICATAGSEIQAKAVIQVIDAHRVIHCVLMSWSAMPCLRAAG